jgi:hypothetical protein
MTNLSQSTTVRPVADPSAALPASTNTWPSTKARESAGCAARRSAALIIAADKNLLAGEKINHMRAL